LDDDNDHRQVTHDLVQFLTSALTFLLQALEVRNSHAKQLDDDRCGNVRHNTQSKNRSITKSTSGEHIEQSEKALRATVLQGRQLIRVDAGYDNE